MADLNFTKQQRVLEITCAPQTSSQQFRVATVKYRRDGTAGTTFNVPFAAVAGSPEDVILDELIEGPMIIRLTGTIT